jgi:excisionase family DNA binding protein
MAAQRNEAARQHGDGPTGEGGGAVQFLTVAEVAEIMRVSKMTVYRLVHSGELPAVRVGKSFRVPERSVHEYLESSYYDADAG